MMICQLLFPSLQIPLPASLFWFSFMMGNLHWIGSYLLITQTHPADNSLPISPGRICLALFAYIFGIFFLYISDCQKYFVLKHQKPRGFGFVSFVYLLSNTEKG
eukprot:TRINITY_DN513_c0_g1_i2.p1 TRINITY_DN513_c0_g1~~TRINITY_DN513_c0_g1_i2.p1  ORF type:complete len:104 (+),score=16.70 TRINITY_DN513_c0_g1_i2:295-606(+)